AAVIAPARITLRILVGQDRTLGRQHRGAGVVFGGNHLQALLLASAFLLNRLPDLGVDLLENIHPSPWGIGPRSVSGAAIIIQPPRMVQRRPASGGREPTVVFPPNVTRSFGSGLVI